MLKECDGKLTEMGDTLKRIHSTLERNTVSLEYHSARSDRLEKIVDTLENRWYNINKQLYLLVGGSVVIQALIMYLLTR